MPSSNLTILYHVRSLLGSTGKTRLQSKILEPGGLANSVGMNNSCSEKPLTGLSFLLGVYSNSYSFATNLSMLPCSPLILWEELLSRITESTLGLPCQNLNCRQRRLRFERNFVLPV